MNITMKSNVNLKSLTLQHNILLEATNLLVGREESLQTEKEVYLMMAIMDAMIEENLIELCNNDERNLLDIIQEEIEPLFIKLMEEEEFQNLYKKLLGILLQYQREIWERQHSVMGLVNTALTALEALSPEDTKEILEATGELAKKAYDKRTEELSVKADAANDKLQQLIQKYQRESNIKE